MNVPLESFRVSDECPKNHKNHVGFIFIFSPEGDNYDPCVYQGKNGGWNLETATKCMDYKLLLDLPLELSAKFTTEMFNGWNDEFPIVMGIFQGA